MSKDSQSTNGDPSLLVVILAAGQGTRMRSSIPKVLHPVAGLSMLGHAMRTAMAASDCGVVVVTSPGQDDVRREASRVNVDTQIAIQEDQLGTAHAVLSARETLNEHDGPVLVLYGDTPLVRPETLSEAIALLTAGDDVVVVGFDTSNPTGYGRLMLDENGKLQEIVEDADASPEQRMVTLCNSGIVALGAGKALSILDRIGNDNAKGEFYLTDAVAIARTDGSTVGVVLADAQDVQGVNSRSQLAEVENIYQQRARLKTMDAGVTMFAPDTVTLSYDTDIAADVVIEPNVFLAPGVSIATGARIRAFSYLEQAHVGSNAIIGPYARLRPGTQMGADTRVGNFVEVKAAEVGNGSKINHLSYVGDARIGEGANIGAGTITCNYDGFAKHKTEIGDGAFIGSNSALVAPVKIGTSAYVGSGSVITRNVSDGALAVTRAAQTEKLGWVEKFRTLMTRRKQKSS